MTTPIDPKPPESITRIEPSHHASISYVVCTYEPDEAAILRGLKRVLAIQPKEKSS